LELSILRIPSPPSGKYQKENNVYNCQANKCKNNGGTPLTAKKQPCNTIIVERREKTYQRTVRKGKRRGFIEEIEGWEIAKEIKVCASCYERLTGLKAARLATSLQALLQKKNTRPPNKKRKKFRKDKKPGNNDYRKRKPSNDRKSSD
jgi:hypothetical protein